MVVFFFSPPLKYVSSQFVPLLGSFPWNDLKWPQMTKIFLGWSRQVEDMVHRYPMEGKQKYQQKGMFSVAGYLVE